jgi:hypothetical protein
MRREDSAAPLADALRILWNVAPTFRSRLAIQSVSLAAGERHDLVTQLGADHAGHDSLAFGRLAGTSPGLAVDGTTLALNPDPYFTFTLSTPSTPPLKASLGLLSAKGIARAEFSLPAGAFPGLAGSTLHHAVVTILPTAAVPLTAVTASVRVQFVP